MKSFITKIVVLMFCLLAGQTFNGVAQVMTPEESWSNYAIKAQITRSNAQAKARADAEYLRLHPDQATNALTKHQLELLDITGNRIARSNYSLQYHTPQELQELTNVVSLFLTNAAAQSSYYYYKRGGMTKEQYMSNLVSHMRQSIPWPETPEKWRTLRFCADVLRSALDTNRIATAYAEMANRPDDAIAIRYVSNVAISNLNEFAAYLTDPKLNVYENFAYIKSTRTNEGVVSFVFWSTNGPVKHFDKHTVNERPIAGADFAENGKLLKFREYAPDNYGVWTIRNQLIFNEDGTLRSFKMGPK